MSGFNIEMNSDEYNTCAFCPGWSYQDRPHVSTWNDQLYKQTNKQEYSIGPVVLEITHVTTTEYAQCQISTFYIL